jgi:lysophospholipase L1-like esterase
MKPRMKRLARRLALSLAATAVALLGAEVAARRTYGEGFNMLVDPYEEHIYRPFLEYEQTSGDRKLRFYTNSLGWKDERPDRVVEKRPPGARVVFLGDSFVEGLGVPQKDTLSGVAQRALDASGTRLEVLNGGRSSFSPILEYQRLKRFLQAGYETDMVVLLYDVSDVQDELYYRGRYLFAPDGEPLRISGRKNNPVLRAVYNESALVRSLSRLPEQLRALRSGDGGGGGDIRPGAQVAKAPEKLPPGYFRDPKPISAGQLQALPSAAFSALRANWMAHPPSLQGWAGEGLSASFGHILRAKRLADSRQIEFLLVIYPWPQLLYTRDDPQYYRVLQQTFGHWMEEREAIYGRSPAPVVSEYQRRMHRFCRDNGIPLLDLIPAFQAVPEWHRLFIPGDVHFNEAGSRLAGLRIAEAIRRAGIGGGR